MWKSKVSKILDAAVASMFFIIWIVSFTIAIWAGMWGDKQSLTHFTIIAMVALVPYFFFSGRENNKNDCAPRRGATPQYGYYVNKHKGLQ